MKIAIEISLFIIAFVILCSFKIFLPLKTATLSITITDLRSTTADVLITICAESPNFPSDQKIIKSFIEKPNGKKVITVTIPNLPEGEYAVTTFQDMNGDGKLTTNFIGAPKDPFGFSNNFKPRFKGPKWNDCKFFFSEQNNQQTIKLITLF